MIASVVQPSVCTEGCGKGGVHVHALFASLLPGQRRRHRRVVLYVGGMGMEF